METVVLQIVDDYGLGGGLIIIIAYLLWNGEFTFRYPRSNKKDDHSQKGGMS